MPRIVRRVLDGRARRLSAYGPSRTANHTRANAQHVAVRRGFVSSGRSQVLQIGGKGRLVVLDTAWSMNYKRDTSVKSGAISKT